MNPLADANPVAGYQHATSGVSRRREDRAQDRLPVWRDVLAVVAHPDDESLGLGALVASFVAAGSRVSVLCFTRGEASTLHGVEGDLATVRARELAERHDRPNVSMPVPSWVRHDAPAGRGFVPWR